MWGNWELEGGLPLPPGGGGPGLMMNIFWLEIFNFTYVLKTPGCWLSATPSYTWLVKVPWSQWGLGYTTESYTLNPGKLVCLSTELTHQSSRVSEGAETVVVWCGACWRSTETPVYSICSSLYCSRGWGSTIVVNLDYRSAETFSLISETPPALKNFVTSTTYYT